MVDSVVTLWCWIHYFYSIAIKKVFTFDQYKKPSWRRYKSEFLVNLKNEGKNDMYEKLKKQVWDALKDYPMHRYSFWSHFFGVAML